MLTIPTVKTEYSIMGYTNVVGPSIWLLRSLYCYLLAKFDCAAKPLTAMRRYDALHLDSDDALRSIGNI